MYTADAKPTHTDQVFSEAPTITLALPGWVSLPDTLSYVFGLNVAHSPCVILWHGFSLIIARRP